MRAGQGSGSASEGRLTARVGSAPGQLTPPGLHRIAPGGARENFLLYVPVAANSALPAPLAVMLHGAGGAAEGGLRLLADQAEADRLLLLAPQSRGRTWDVLVGGFGVDVTAIDAALAETFSRCAVDPARIAIGGFSDGASYALSLGLTNGDLFSAVLAFSPGFAAPGRPHGAPRVFISHGTRDAVLPVDRCSRRLVPRLRQAGYEVEYDEFDGPHKVPPEVARHAVEWWLSEGPP